MSEQLMTAEQRVHAAVFPVGESTPGGKPIDPNHLEYDDIVALCEYHAAAAVARVEKDLDALFADAQRMRNDLALIRELASHSCANPAVSAMVNAALEAQP